MYNIQERLVPTRYVSPTNYSSSRGEVRDSSVTKYHYSPSSIYYEQQRSDIRQQSNPSVSPTVSFGAGGSSLKKTFTLKNGDFYEGDLNSNGDFHGYGRYFYNNQRIQYQGLFQNGKPHGHGQLFKKIYGSSIVQSPNSKNQFRQIIYDGQWHRGMKHGQGKYTYEFEGQHYYQGPWQNDQRHGQNGKYVSPIGTYIGRWERGKMSGKGCFTIKKTGTIYDGIFENNEFEKGLINYKNKDQYRGMARNGERDDTQGRYIYRGRYRRRNKDYRTVSPKKNIHSLSSQSSIDQKDIDPKDLSNWIVYSKQYFGGWRGGHKHGKCVINYANEDSCKCIYQNGFLPPSMQCTYEWSDHSQFNGWLKRDNHGKYVYQRGTFKDPNGNIVEV